MISLRDVVTGFGNRDPLAEVWRRSLRGGGGGSAEITGTLPLRYIGNGKPLTDYMIYGNTVQNGTPSPKAPVDVMGCGVWDETRQSYKLPPTVNGTEYPIYLGQVETTRKVKKWVLDGTETWSKGNYPPAGGYQFFTPKPSDISDNPDWLTTHFKKGSVLNGSAFGSYLSLYPGASILPENATANDFKSYLAAQYATGTPVTVWYVLAEPVTGIVNEPLMKIGDYADTISFAQAGVTIPTVSGANVLDMTSTVKPSEVYIEGKGIKPTGYGQLVDNNSVRILVHGQ